ncbi:MAG: 8-amino-7-oxononanoate synthase [Methylococcales bacterium]|nr:8-amino-7-oxononanoate synthase [Methylococcales bacterium]
MTEFWLSSEQLAERAQAGRKRQVRCQQRVASAKVFIDGTQLIDFASNDYLGLSQHPSVIQAFQQAATAGVGAGSAQLLGGYQREHQALAQALADFTGRERVLLFGSGYLANMGVLSGLVGRRDALLQDRLNHASLLDAGVLSGAIMRRFQHRDYDHLERLLKQSQGRRWVVSETVFSMDGDCADIAELNRLCRQHQACLILDDAHGFGVFGNNGQGLASVCSADQAPVVIATFGKALGGYGAFVAGSHTLIETLEQQARSFIYSTALPPAVAAAAHAALTIVRDQPEHRERLLTLIERFRQGAAELGLALLPSSTPIQPVLMGDHQRALATAKALAERGFNVPAIRPPTVPEGTARLRITLTAAHSESDIDALLTALAEVLL